MTPALKPIPPLSYPRGSRGAVLQMAASQVGYREGWNGRYYNNDNAFGVWYPMNYVAWCAIFVSWAAYKAGVSTNVIPKHAYTPSGQAWFRAKGALYTTPMAGDVGYVYYSGLGRVGHVFLVEKVWRTEQGALLMYTLEGNTNDTGSSQGNGVYRLTRADTTNLSYGRPAYAYGGDGGGEPIPPPPPPDPPEKEEEDMRFITVVGDTNKYGYTDSDFWVATDEEIGSFGIATRNVNARQRDVIRARVLSFGQDAPVGLVKVVGAGAETGKTFLVSAGNWTEVNAEEVYAWNVVFGPGRIREVNQRAWDVMQSLLSKV